MNTIANQYEEDYANANTGYLPMECGPGEVGVQLYKATVAEAELTPRPARSERYANLEDYGNGEQPRTFCPPGCRDEVFESVERLRQADATGAEPKTANAPRYGQDPGFSGKAHVESDYDTEDIRAMVDRINARQSG